MSARERRRSDQMPPAHWTHTWADEADWVDRCARRIIEIDPTCSHEEAAAIARDMLAFERTGVMEPEAAIEFVVGEFSKSVRGPLERRSEKR
jgi:hypothetical protein